MRRNLVIRNINIVSRILINQDLSLQLSLNAHLLWRLDKRVGAIFPLASIIWSSESDFEALQLSRQFVYVPWLLEFASVWLGSHWRFVWSKSWSLQKLTHEVQQFHCNYVYELGHVNWYSLLYCYLPELWNNGKIKFWNWIWFSHFSFNAVKNSQAN